MNHATLGTYSLVELSSDVPAALPLVLTLVVDVSGSMAPFMAYVVNACLATVDALKDGSLLKISTFDNHVKKIVESVRARARAPTLSALGTCPYISHPPNRLR